MEDHAEQTLFGIVSELEPVPAFALLFSIVCTSWLVVSRIRGCFRFHAPNLVRDIALLSTGPVSALLISIIKAAAGIHTFLRPGLDADLVFFHALSEIVGVCYVSIICFVAGVFSIMLPIKADAQVA